MKIRNLWDFSAWIFGSGKGIVFLTLNQMNV